MVINVAQHHQHKAATVGRARTVAPERSSPDNCLALRILSDKRSRVCIEVLCKPLED